MRDVVPFSEALRFWIKLGFISFGGPAGQIAVMQKELVDKRRWIEQVDFLHALSYCMLLPGPEAQQLATYIGWRLHGIRGGIAAGSLFVLPSIFFLLVLSYLYAAYGAVPLFSSVLDGFKAVVVAIVVEAVVKIGARAFRTVFHVAIAVTAFGAISVFGVPFPLIVLGAGLLGILFLRGDSGSLRENSDVEELIHGRNRGYVLKVTLSCFALWIVPLLAITLLLGETSFPAKAYLFFTQSAFVTFGGAYAVLAYVNQAVVSSGWITQAQAVDGLALAETTPGPLIMVLQFIGFMTGWNNPAGIGQTGHAILCALATTYVTFLPSFLFIFIGAPFIERLRNNRILTAALSGVTAAVVGVILNLALMFGAAVIFPSGTVSYLSFTLAAAAFVLLYFFRAGVILVVVAGGLCGVAKYLLVG